MRAVVARAPRAITLSSRLRTGTNTVARAPVNVRTSFILRTVQVAHLLSRYSARDFSVKASAAMAQTSNPLLTAEELPLYDKVCTHRRLS